MAPLLVVEDEAVAGAGAEPEHPTREFAISRFGNRLWPFLRFGRAISERLARVVEGFRMHVLVAHRELHEIRISLASRDPVDQSVGDFLAVGERVAERRQRQLPARVVGHGGGVVEAVGVRQNRRSLLARAPEAPPLLEPGDMTYLPARRIDDREPRPELALAGEVVGDAPGAAAGRPQLLEQRFGLHARLV